MILLFSILFTSLLSVHVSVHLFVLTYNQTLMYQTKPPSLNFVFCHQETLRAESKIILQSHNIVQKITLLLIILKQQGRLSSIPSDLSGYI